MVSSFFSRLWFLPYHTRPSSLKPRAALQPAPKRTFHTSLCALLTARWSGSPSSADPFSRSIGPKRDIRLFSSLFAFLYSSWPTDRATLLSASHSPSPNAERRTPPDVPQQSSHRPILEALSLYLSFSLHSTAPDLMIAISLACPTILSHIVVKDKALRSARVHLVSQHSSAYLSSLCSESVARIDSCLLFARHHARRAIMMLEALNSHSLDSRL